VASPRSFWRRQAPLLVAAALVMAFTVAAIAAWRELHLTHGEPASVAPRAGGTSRAPLRALEPTTRSAEPAEESTAQAAPPEKSNVVPAPRRSAGEGGDAYAAELALLQRAREAVASGKFGAALDAIVEHQRRFPAGRLREEREALRIKALTGLGRNDEARLAAQRFRERFPRSVLSGRIEETLRPNP
jgi:hypothetical protein